MTNRQNGFLKSIMMFSVTWGLAISAQAQNDIRLGQPIYGGTGCPQGTASAAVTPDGKQISILFDQFVAEAGANGKRIDRKSCDLAVPLHVPQGYSVSIFTIDYRGFTSLPAGSYAKLNAEYFIAGQHGPLTQKNFTGPQSQNYIYTNNEYILGNVWSACGTDVNLRVNAAMFVQTNSHLDDAMATVDSEDLHTGIIFHVQWRTCI